MYRSVREGFSSANSQADPDSMASLKYCANISWLFTEWPEFSERLRAAGRAGFQAVEAAWLYGSDPRELQKVREETGLQVALINTPPGKSTQTYRRRAQLSSAQLNLLNSRAHRHTPSWLLGVLLASQSFYLPWVLEKVAYLSDRLHHFPLIL